MFYSCHVLINIVFANKDLKNNHHLTTRVIFFLVFLTKSIFQVNIPFQKCQLPILHRQLPILYRGYNIGHRVVQYRTPVPYIGPFSDYVNFWLIL